MFELTRDWVRERKAFGKRVADLQTVLRLFRRLSQFFGSIRNSCSSGPTQASRAQDCSHRMQSFLGLVPFTAQQVKAGQRDVEHGQVLGHRPGEPGGRRLPANARRLGLHERDENLPVVRRRARPNHLRRQQRNHERAYRKIYRQQEEMRRIINQQSS